MEVIADAEIVVPEIRPHDPNPPDDPVLGTVFDTEHVDYFAGHGEFNSEPPLSTYNPWLEPPVFYQSLERVDHEDARHGISSRNSFTWSEETEASDMPGFTLPRTNVASDHPARRTGSSDRAGLHLSDRIWPTFSATTASTSKGGPLSPAAVAALPKKKLDEEELGPEGKGECSVCIDEVHIGDEVVMLPCNHWYHETCAGTWLIEHNTCPMCRRAIDGHAAASSPSHPSHSSLRLEGAVGERPWRGSVRSRMRNDNTTLYSSSRTLDQPRFVGRSTLDTDNTFRDHPLYQYVTSKADGLYHCPWEGDERCQHRPEKLKANYDKFVDSHLKPYRCKAVACENSKFSSTACLLRHEREAHPMHGHGDKPYLCTYVGCDRGITGNGFPRHWNLRDHIKRYHNDLGTSSKHSLPSDGASTQLINRGKKRKPEELLAPRANRSANADITTHAQERNAFDRYRQNQQRLEEIVKELENPENSDTMILLHQATECVKVMSQITLRINTPSSNIIQRGVN